MPLPMTTSVPLVAHARPLHSCVVGRPSVAPARSRRAAQTLNSGIRLVGSRAGFVSSVRPSLAAPVEGHEDGVLPDGRGEVRREAWRGRGAW